MNSDYENEYCVLFDEFWKERSKISEAVRKKFEPIEPLSDMPYLVAEKEAIEPLRLEFAKKVEALKEKYGES